MKEKWEHSGLKSSEQVKSCYCYRRGHHSKRDCQISIFEGKFVNGKVNKLITTKTPNLQFY